MKINQFVQVDIPKNIDYMSRFGNVTPRSEQFSGDQEIPREANKADDLERYAEWAEMMKEQEAKKTSK